MKKSLIILLFIFFSIQTGAKLFLEPFYFQTPTGNVDSHQTPGDVDFQYETKTTAHGGRIGFMGNIDLKGAKNSKYIVGLEYIATQSNWDFKLPTTQKSTYESSGKDTRDVIIGEHYGVFASNKLGNFYLTVGGAISIFRDKNNNSPINYGNTYTGTTVSYGVGYALFNILKLTIEFRQYNLTLLHDTVTNQDYSLPNQTINKGKVVVKELSFSLSLPITIF